MIESSESIVSEQSEVTREESLRSKYLDQNPYPGLNSYDEEREEYFHGRDNERKEILQILAQQGLCFLIGKSGMGKSSLINAGLIPELKRNGYIPITIRINFDLIDSYDTEDPAMVNGEVRFSHEKSQAIQMITLTEQVKHLIQRQLQEIDPTAISFDNLLLWEYFQEVRIFGGYLQPVLIFDQFEEIFTRGNERQLELKELLQEIIDVVENRVPEKVQRELALNNKTVRSHFARNCTVMFALREDYLPQLTSLRTYIPSLKFSLFRLEQMRGSEAFEAVFNPASRHKLMDEETAWAIISKVPESRDGEFDFESDDDENTAVQGDQERGKSLLYTYWEFFFHRKKSRTKPENESKGKGAITKKKIEPFLLNLLCYTLNEERKEKKQEKVTMQDVLTKDFSKLVNDYYDKVTSKSSALSRAIEKSLLTPDGNYRRFAEREEFCKNGSLLKFFGIGKLKERDVQHLVNNKIIRRKRINQLEYFELIHDVLVPIVSQKRFVRYFLNNLLIISLIIATLFTGLVYDSYQRSQDLRAEFRAKARMDSLEQERESRAAILKLRQQAYFDSIRVFARQIEFNSKLELARRDAEVEKLMSINQEKELKELRQRGRFDSLLIAANQKKEEQLEYKQRVFDSRLLAMTSLDNFYPPQKKATALLAYDTLVSGGNYNKDDLFPDLFAALIAAQIDSLRSGEYRTYSETNDYDRIESVFNFNSRFAVSLPFKGIVDHERGAVLLKEPNLLRSWISPDQSMVAMFVAGKSPSFVIQRISDKTMLSQVTLGPFETVISAAFNATGTTCLFSTYMYNEKGKVCKVEIGGSRQPIILSLDLTKNESVFIAYGRDEYHLVSNSGKYCRLSRSTLLPAGTTLHLKLRKVSAACYDYSAGGILIGTEEGKIYKLDQSDLTEFFSNKPTAISNIVCSTDGNWTAAGSSSGDVVLFNRKTRAPSACFIAKGNVYSPDKIQSLCFSPDNERLAAGTHFGTFYNIPLVAERLVAGLCADKRFLQKLELDPHSYRKLKRLCD